MTTVAKLNPLPEATEERPYAQLDWVFARAFSSHVNGHLARLMPLARYKQFLEQSGTALPFDLTVAWDHLSLRRLQLWHDETNVAGTPTYLSSGGIRAVESGVRVAMQWAYEHRLIAEAPYWEPRPAAVRETEHRTAYAPETLAHILDTIGPEVAFARRVRAGYAFTGQGSDPRLDGRTGKKGTGFCNPGKLVWFFENVLGGKPVVATQANTRVKELALFFNGCKVVYGSTEAFYRERGVSLLVDVDLLAPLVIKLATETGLNVESIFSLRRDCFKLEDGLTGLPYLEYRKDRSQGEMAYPLALLDTQVEREPLFAKQSAVVRKTVDLILDLTAPLLGDAPADAKDCLLLVQRASSTRTHQYGSAMAMTHRHVWDWMAKVFSAGVADEAPGTKRSSFNLAKFRPTFVTEMVRKGYDVFEVQALMGHRSVLTTYGYISKHHLDSDFQRDMTKQLEVIKANAATFKGIPIAVQGQSTAGRPFKAGMCNCTNPFAPPERIRKASKFVEGNACTYFNMCLTCENVLVTEQSLPKLINYKLQIEMELAVGLANEPRKSSLYERTLTVIEQILKPDELFTRAELDVAHQFALANVDDLLDEFLYS